MTIDVMDSPPSLRVLTSNDVKRVVDEHLSLDRLLDETARLFYKLSHPGTTITTATNSTTSGATTATIQCPGRTSIYTDSYTLLTMAGDVNELGTSVKMVSVPKSSSSSPLLSSKAAASDKRGGRDIHPSIPSSSFRSSFLISSVFVQVLILPAAAGEGPGLGPRLRPRGLPATTVVFDEKDGRAKAVVNARELTALRTAMGSLLATELVMMEEVKIPTSIEEEEVVVDNGVPDNAPLNTKRKPPVTLVLFGCGLQIEYHARMLLLRFRSIRRCILLNRTRNQRAKRLQKRLWSFVRNARAPNETATVSLYTRINEEEEEEQEGEEQKQKEEVEQQREESTFERYVRQADILCFATSATEPLLEDSCKKYPPRRSRERQRSS
ncbi:hypothetical protein FRC16_004903 [Serendipita sp. 398]|nr:hypothetical protein FRC16_004903 [Serendipita sp. 398]